MEKFVINEYQQKKTRFSTINTETKANRKLRKQRKYQVTEFKKKKKQEGISKNRKVFIKNIIAKKKIKI